MRKLFLAALAFVSFSMANAQSKTSGGGGKVTFGALDLFYHYQLAILGCIAIWVMVPSYS